VLIQVDQQNLTITLLKKKALSKNILAEIHLRFATFHAQGMASTGQPWLLRLLLGGLSWSP